MAVTLPSVVGHKDNREPELNVNSKDDIINKKINERMKRKEKLMEELNKIHDPDIA
jgi:hypothetical protein